MSPIPPDSPLAKVLTRLANLEARITALEEAATAPKERRATWPTERCDKLVRMVIEGHSASEIADALNCTTRAVTSRLHMLRNDPGAVSFEWDTSVRINRTGSWSPEEDALVSSLYAVGLGPTEVRKALRRNLGCTRTTGAISQRAHNLGLTGSDS